MTRNTQLGNASNAQRRLPARSGCRAVMPLTRVRDQGQPALRTRTRQPPQDVFNAIEKKKHGIKSQNIP